MQKVIAAICVVVWAINYKNFWDPKTGVFEWSRVMCARAFPACGARPLPLETIGTTSR